MPLYPIVDVYKRQVPTDRFYDDLNLKFEFIRQDSVNHQHFYYKLTEDSPQRLNPTFYSARIKYPEKKEGDKYAAIGLSLCCFMQMEEKDILLLPMDCKLVRL